ncbi:hypothetical protein IFM89_003112 [Coptis chinensis]|uniref:Tr-type G domain-containing protein n=1 Tax=Coptis chinensis TaxID=261450 RepID=A0A835ITR6_9MAGN|nr:hypothetical protein IFM89_003112 [Coptis chinensis]
MDMKDDIRNITVIAHVDHGKTLVGSAGGQDTSRDVRVTLTRADQAEHRTTTKATAFSFNYELSDKSRYLINLIDSPDHIDFSSEVSAAFRMTDGALLVVDGIEGVCMQTETVLCQSLGELVVPVLDINKMDHFIVDLQLDGEEAYQMIQNSIMDANVIMATNESQLDGDSLFCPEKGSIAFCSGLHGWACTLADFAQMYAVRFGNDKSVLVKRLWGEIFFNSRTKKWTTTNTGTDTCKRGFVQFVYDPIKKIINSCLNDQKDDLWDLLDKLNITMKEDEKDQLHGIDLMLCVMRTWLPASTALLKMMIHHLPSPSKAQQY